MKTEAIRTAQEWLATVKSVPPGNSEIQAIIDTIDEALELAMVIYQHIREKHS